MIRGVRTPSKSRLHPIALIENEDGIQASIMEIINALVRNTIDFRRARPILRALHIAVKNSPRVHFDIYKSDMIHEVPNYPAAPPPLKSQRQPHSPRRWRARAHPAPQANQHRAATATHRRRPTRARSSQAPRARQARAPGPQHRAPPLRMRKCACILPNSHNIMTIL